MSPSLIHRPFLARHRATSRIGRVVAVLAATGAAALVAVPAGALTARPAQASRTAAAASCPWVSSSAPISQRVAQVMAKMTLPNEITMVEGHGTTNPYVFYMAGIPSLCIPSMGEEDGPNGVADGLTGVTQLPAGVALAATFDPVAGPPLRPGRRQRGGRQGRRGQPRARRSTSTATRAGAARSRPTPRTRS